MRCHQRRFVPLLVQPSIRPLTRSVLDERRPSCRPIPDIVCEDVQTDLDNPRRVTLAGLISAIRSLEEPPFPLLYRELCIFLQLTGCRGGAEGRVEVQHADSGQVVFRTGTRTIPFGNDPLEIVGVTFRIRDCLFPEPGLYWVRFWYNETMISQQPLLLR
jgi:hypothetical protein